LLLFGQQNDIILFKNKETKRFYYKKYIFLSVLCVLDKKFYNLIYKKQTNKMNLLLNKYNFD
jgi:hypothetical protein